MKIAFLDDNKLDYTPETPFHRPLGGAESTAAYLTAALAARGHEIALINENSRPGEYRGVKTPGRRAARADVLNSFDAVVVLTRQMCGVLRNAGVKTPLISWQHKAASTNEMSRLRDPANRPSWTSIVYVSEHQRQTYTRMFGMDGVVIRNAASPAALASPVQAGCFLDRGEDPTMIFASAPGHGLDMLLATFAATREVLPGARLKVCSDQGLYQTARESDPYSALYALARALPGVEFIGSVSQTQLGAAMATSDILAYPTSFMETSCIVAIEAAAAGCLHVGNDFGPLKETLGGYGVFTPHVDSRAGTARNVSRAIVEAVQAARADPEAYKARRAQQAQWFRSTHTWEQRAAEWEAYLSALLQPGA